LHNNLGFAYMQTGRAEDAKRHFQQAIDIDPDNADAHFNLGSILTSEHNPDQASQHYAIAARLDPRYANLITDQRSD
jgi:Tfp pilus assembly protein PilF